jgi:hypothetical protein
VTLTEEIMAIVESYLRGLSDNEWEELVKRVRRHGG